MVLRARAQWPYPRAMAFKSVKPISARVSILAKLIPAGMIGNRKGIAKGIAIALGILVAPMLAVGQEGQTVNLSQGPPSPPYQKIFFYSGSNLTYLCSAKSSPAQQSTISITSATSATPAVFTSTAHGFYSAGAAVKLGTPRVTISGAPAAWAALNSGSWLLSATGVDTFQLLNPSTGTAFDGGALAAWSGSATVTASAPRTSMDIWSIAKYVYDGSNNIIWSGQAFASQGLTRNTCVDPTVATIEWR